MSIRPELLKKLRCPDCEGVELIDAPLQLTCAGCATDYEVVDGVPILLPAKCRDDRHKESQIRFYDEEIQAEYEINRPHGCGRVYQYLMDYKVSMALDRFGDIGGKELLDVCCGSGMDLEYFAKHGARVTGLDISLANIQRAQARAAKFGFTMDGVVGDAEILPFRDGAFDLSFAHDGLHHLADPKVAVRELGRAARERFCVIEPARALGTKVMVMLGISEHVEEAGNIVYRLGRDDFRPMAEQQGWKDCEFRRYFMYYRHWPGWFMKLFSIAPLFPLYKLGFATANAILGPIGNKCFFYAAMPPAKSRGR